MVQEAPDPYDDEKYANDESEFYEAEYEKTGVETSTSRNPLRHNTNFNPPI